MDEWYSYLFEKNKSLFYNTVFDMDFKFRFRIDSIEIDATCGNLFRTITIEDLSRLPDAISFLKRDMELDEYGLLDGFAGRCPQGITYQTLKPTTGEVKIVIDYDH